MSGRKGVDAPAFWETVEPHLADEGVEEGTLMGFPCVRVGGEFFAMPKHDTGELVCKLPAERVAALVADETGRPFGPGEKIFKEWVLIPLAHEDHWADLVVEARAFVGS